MTRLAFGGLVVPAEVPERAAERMDLSKPFVRARIDADRKLSHALLGRSVESDLIAFLAEGRIYVVATERGQHLTLQRRRWDRRVVVIVSAGACAETGKQNK